MPKIFKSNITLYFRDKYYNTKYSEQKLSFRKKYNIILSSFLTILSIAITILMIIIYPQLKEHFNTTYSAIYCFTTGILSVIIILLCLIVKGNKFQEWLTYLSYLLIIFVFTNIRYYFVWVYQIDLLLYTLIFVIEIIFRLIWFVIGLIDFVPGVYLQVISIIFNICIISPINPLPFMFRMAIYNCILILTTIMSYFYIKERKSSFYYNLSLKLKNEWYESIIDNMNSGFISIKDGEIQCYNKTLLNFIRKTDGEEIILNNNDNVNFVKELNIDELFINVINENKKIDSFEQMENILNSKYTEIGDKFVFLGTKDIEVTPASFINLEVFGRCFSSSHNKIDRHEFIFNDITRSKQIEQNNAEIKYKTLFLSKIAHEFKNPLLCISELVEQVHDNLLTDKQIKIENNNSEILKQIKALSNYLIILVKDMDFFSQKSSGTIQKKIEPDKVELNGIVKFCIDIVNALLSKSQKQANINFRVIQDKILPTYITTDEIKLKQILINLLSNAVKYTYSGSIILKITLENSYLKFEVEDTGKGISENQKDKIFTPFSNEFDKLNKVSSGLGLSIVKELVELLGSKIEYTSTVGKGSSFWFTLLLDENDLKYKYESDTTIIGVHYNEEPIKARLDINIQSDDPSLDAYNIIVADDDIVIRQATIRLLRKAFKEKSISVKILEASDGIECLNIYYSYLKDGESISFILSDETMVYMNGTYAAQVLEYIASHKNIAHVPFYILSAYENLLSGSGKDAVDGIFSKPLRKQYIEEILNKLEIS
jgi:signal transduction histidine kinase